MKRILSILVVVIVNVNVIYAQDNPENYLRFSPYAITLGLKACGYQGRSNWGELAVSGAISNAVMVGVVTGLKGCIHEDRPDETDNKSFPSGHTAAAFVAATILHKEYFHRSPWFSIAGYGLAATTGVLRLVHDRHHPGDVVAGAAIGILSTELGYFITDHIFKKHKKGKDTNIEKY